jgi:putative SbcD/Mre11-related phosphoesterase
MRVLNDWLLTPGRVAIHLPTATAVVADLHLGYAQARQRRGEAVPVLPLEQQLAPLAAVMTREDVRRLVIAGDLLEDGRAGQKVREEFIAGLLHWLAKSGLDLVAVVPGNHDHGLEGSTSLPVYPGGFELGGWQVIHGDGEPACGRVVQGHEHPWLRWSNQLSAPCYLVEEQRLVLPAFSLDAAGGNVLSGQRWDSCCCYVIAGDRVLDFGPVGKLRLVSGAE